MSKKDGDFKTLIAEEGYVQKVATQGKEIVNFETLQAATPGAAEVAQINGGTVAVANGATVVAPFPGVVKVLGFTVGGGDTTFTATKAGTYSISFKGDVSADVADAGGLFTLQVKKDAALDTYTKYQFEVLATSVNTRTVQVDGTIILAVGSVVTFEYINGLATQAATVANSSMSLIFIN